MGDSATASAPSTPPTLTSDTPASTDVLIPPTLKFLLSNIKNVINTHIIPDNCPTWRFAIQKLFVANADEVVDKTLPRDFALILRGLYDLNDGGMDDGPDQDLMVPSSRAIVVPGLLSQRRESTQPNRRILVGNHGLLCPRVSCRPGAEKPLQNSFHQPGEAENLNSFCFHLKPAENRHSFCFHLKPAENLHFLLKKTPSEPPKSRDDDRRRRLEPLLGATFVNPSQTPPHKILSLSPKLSLSFYWL
ncbi:hypothetical protein M5K25_026516 [Dendrobium thyrsiflorum]|uniref:Uncharacterized protein n=1 Tax=Dendrobium thyrsiflorum TaxID=117978 RepID=A0ABD0TXR0_DENTH